MKKDNLPFYHFFDDLRQSQECSLGIEDYFVLVEALQGGFGINKETGNLDKDEILTLCKTLWLKPNQSPYMFEQIFHQYLQNAKNVQQNETSIDKQQDTHKGETKDNPNPSENLSNNDRENEPKKDIEKVDTQHEEKNRKTAQETEAASAEKLRFEVSIGGTQTDKGGINDSKTGQLNSRTFLFSDDYYPLNIRQVHQMWRALPLKVNGQHSTQIDFQTTIQSIAQKGYLEKLHYQKRRQSLNHVLLLTDHQGSMIAFELLTDLLKEGLENAFKDYNQAENKVKQFYFYNVPQEHLYKNYAHTEYIEIKKLIAEYKQKSAAIIILSDAGAARGGNAGGRVRATIRSLFHLQSLTAKIVWLNPMPQERWENTSAERIARFVPMYVADEKGIQQAINFLKGKTTNLQQP